MSEEGLVNAGVASGHALPAPLDDIEREVAAAIQRSITLGTSISTSSVDTVSPLSILTMTFSGSSTTCRETTARISARRTSRRSG